MKYLPEFEENIRRLIRDAKAADPLVTIGDFQRLCERRFNRTFSPRYIKKLCEKVYRQSLIEVDRTKLDERLNITREKFSERLLKIIQWSLLQNSTERGEFPLCRLGGRPEFRPAPA